MEDVAKLEREHVNTIFPKMDAGSMFSDVVSCVDWLGERVSTQNIDVVVHSISGASVGRALNTSPLGVEKTFNRLAHSYLWWVQRLLQTNLLAPHCTFVALSNPCPDFYLDNTGVIGAAKAALETYVKTLGVELGRLGHRAVGVRFSTVVTPALEKVMPAAIPGLRTLHQYIQPFGYITTCDDIAHIVASLVKLDTPFINATVIDATGGAPYMLMDYAFHQAAK
jgi:enoyl-[acyl-carrier-protein] reductase (NADH)